MLIVCGLMVCMCTGVSAQGWLNRIKEKAVEKIKEKVEKKVENAVEGTDGDALATDGDGQLAKRSAEEGPAVNTSTDFRRGAVILFQDDVKGERVGEFPSKWDLLGGNAEVKTLGGKNVIEVTNNGVITPLLKQQGAYLPEEFTLEYEFFYWAPGSKQDIGINDLKLWLINTADRTEPNVGEEEMSFELVHGVCETEDQHYRVKSRTTDFSHTFSQGWHHVALSFNKRALKVYFDGRRVINLPNVQQPSWFAFQVPFEYHDLTFIRNVVLAKGAVELYDRNAQDLSAVEKAIQQTGKFVTNNILFETGKATLKPESMAEIQKVADYMKKNPTVRFEVQGHTDSQGSDKVNDPLSQQRAEAVVKALEALGVDVFNLRPVGKGAHEPQADNQTEAGRTKNRRVEFVKK